METKQDLKNKLSVGKWIVEFKKVDGTNSTMECTLDGKYIPPVDSVTEKRKISESDETLRVYSIDRSGWRSFRTANLMKIYRSPDNL